MQKKNENIVHPIDLTHLLAGLEGMWVLLSNDMTQVLATSKSLKDIPNTENGIVMKAPPTNVVFAPSVV